MFGSNRQELDKAYKISPFEIYLESMWRITARPEPITVKAERIYPPKGNKDANVQGSGNASNKGVSKFNSGFNKIQELVLSPWGRRRPAVSSSQLPVPVREYETN